MFNWLNSPRIILSRSVWVFSDVKSSSEFRVKPKSPKENYLNDLEILKNKLFHNSFIWFVESKMLFGTTLVSVDKKL